MNKQRHNLKKDITSNEAIAVGKFAIGILLSSFNCINAQAFAALNLIDATYITISLILHTGCARHGQFEYRSPRSRDLLWSTFQGEYRFRSTWRKTRKSNIPYFVLFKRIPSRASFLYHVRQHHGVSDESTPVTAAQVIGWYLRRPDVMPAHSASDDALLFPALPFTHRRIAYQNWLQRVFSLALATEIDIHSRTTVSAQEQ